MAENVATCSSDILEISCVILGAILAYGFGRFQHHREYKEELKHIIFGTLLSVELPSAYVEFIENPKSPEKYNVFINKLKELGKKCSILQLRNRKKYLQIKDLIIKIDDLSGFNTYHLVEGVEIPVQITEVNAIKERKKDIDVLFKRLYRTIGTDNYKNVMYVGHIKYFLYWLYDCFFNKYE